MDESSEIGTMDVNNQLTPGKKFFRYLTLQDCENQVFLFCYILFLMGSLTAIVLVFIRKTVLLTTHDVYNELCDFIAKRDAIRCIRIIRKHPQLVNMFYGSSQYTPFLRACLHGSTQLVRYMIASGADIHLKSLNGESAFYLATYHLVRNQELTDATCIHTLYYAGANVNEPNSKGFNPLQLAAYFGHHRLVKWLLRKGADVHVTPHPYTLARQQGQEQTAHMLRLGMHTPNSAS